MRKCGLTVFALCVTIFAQPLKAQIINTVVGGWVNSGGPAVNAAIFPNAIAIDGSDNIYIADQECRVHKIDPTGTLTTIAGTGETSFTGDGGPATAASFYALFGITADNSGNVYVPDCYNNRIRKIDASGTITTISGTGAATVSGDGGLAISASLNRPHDVALDATGNIYIADYDGGRIRKISTDGTIASLTGITTTGADGDPATTCATVAPAGVCVDAANNIYVSAFYNNAVRKIDNAGIINIYAGDYTYGYGGDGGPATATNIYAPVDVTIDGSGNLYIGDMGNHRIRKVDASGIISTIAGTGGEGFSGDGGPATAAMLDNPAGAVKDAAGRIYIADVENRRIRKIELDGTISTYAGGYTGKAVPAAQSALYWPFSTSFDSHDNMYIADQANNLVRMVNTAGVITTIAGTGATGFGGDGGAATNAKLNRPAAVAVDGAGNIFIADKGNNRIRKIDASGNISTIAGTATSGSSGDGGPAVTAKLNQPSGLTFNRAGELLIADCANSRIRKINASGVISSVTNMATPIGITTDNFDNIIVTARHEITKVTSDGTKIPVAGTFTPGYSGDGGPATKAQLYNPTGVAVDKNGNIIIADNDNHRVRKVSAGGIISTIAGDGAYGFWGDGGLAEDSRVYQPSGVAVNSSGDIYITDKGNNRIRKINNTLSVAHRQLSATLHVFPNPTTGSVHIQSEYAVKEKITIEVYNIVGQKVYFKETNNNSKNIDETIVLPDGLTNGVYILKVQADGDLRTFPVTLSK